MPFNLPSVDETRFSFGPGILYLGPYAPDPVVGGTPTIDVGGVRPGAELSITRERVVVEQGWPAIQIAGFSSRTTAQFTITSIEWNMRNLAWALGAGRTTQVGATEELAFGMDFKFENLALRFVHVQPSGATIILDMWKVQGLGELTAGFTEDLHELPFTFVALRAPEDWLGNPLPLQESLLKITRISE